MDALTKEQIDENMELLKKLQAAIAVLVRASNKVPSVGDGFEVLATFPEFTQFMNHQRGRIINVLRMLLDGAGLRLLRIDDSRLENMNQLINVNDRLVERIASTLDEHQATLTRDRIKAREIQLGAEPVQQQRTSKMLETSSTSETAVFQQPYKDGGGRYAFLSKTVCQTSTRQTYCTTASTVVQKPQQLYCFQHCIVNVDQPFAHKLRIKHNALERSTGIVKKTGNLKLIIDSNSVESVSSSNYVDDDGARRDWLNDEQGIEETELLNHPYQYELEHFAPTNEQLAVPQRIQYPTKLLHDTPLVMITQLHELEALVRELNSVSEFAFDLEHHSIRSFLGFTCLLQISTRHKDYIVDPFPLWEHMYLLNEPFTNPSIVKVAFSTHGDTAWLQRDFGIYVVGLFDASIAFCTITADDPKLKGGKSLRSLVSRVVRVTLNKTNQMADWRKRPLTETMIDYARSDTHYLLTCYDYLKQQLAILVMERKGKSKAVKIAIANIYEESKKICSMQFIQPRFDPSGYSELVPGHRLNNRQLFALQELWRWRDEIAREQDESLYYVLPPQMMLKIAETLPRESSGILACCTPVPPLVRHELANLERIISIARELPLEQMAQANALSKLLHQQNADDVLGDPTLQNRIVGVKAKLEYRFDYSKQSKSNEQHQANNYQMPHNNSLLLSNGNAEEEGADTILENEEPHIKRRVVIIGNELFENDEMRIRAAKQMDQPLANHQKQQQIPQSNGHDHNGNSDAIIEEEAKQRAKQIYTRLEEQWATPYDTYLVALREAEQQKDVKPNKNTLLADTTTTTKKRYSHLDDDDDEEEEEDIDAIDALKAQK